MNGHCGHMNRLDLIIVGNGLDMSMTGGAMRRHCNVFILTRVRDFDIMQ